MVESICNKLTLRIRKKMPDVDDERAEVINYGLQLAIGEIPKTFIILFVAWLAGVLDLTLISILIITPYRAMVGGAHFKTHVKCVLATSIFYIGTALLSKYIVLSRMIRIMLTATIWIFAVIMISWYAPADTEDVPIISKKVRKQKMILSYIFFILGLIISAVVPSNIISNIIIFGYFVQTCMITRIAYKLTNNKYGYEVYGNATN